MSQQIFRNSPLKYRNNVNSPQFQNNPDNKYSSSTSSNTHQAIDAKTYTYKDTFKFIKNQPLKSTQMLPPRATAYQRAQRSRSRENSIKDKSTSNVSNVDSDKCEQSAEDSRGRTESISKMVQLKKKISQELAEKQKWKQQNQSNIEKVAKLSNELTKMKEQCKYFQDQMERLSQDCKEKEDQLFKTHQLIENLNKTINNNNIHLKGVKQKDSELEIAKNQIKELTFQNQSLKQTLNTLKQQIHKKNISNLQSQNLKKSEIIITLQRQIEKLKQELKTSSYNEKILQTNLCQAQHRLYQKQSELKKISIQMTFMGRKQAQSIDDVKSRKDLEIKVIRDRYNKVNKEIRELRESQDKVDKFDRLKVSKAKDTIKRMKSHKHFRLTSESEDFTFELSSQT